MDMDIRALCTDIDGTLLDGRRQLSDRTIATIKRIQSKIPVVLASSRMPSAMVHLQEELGIVGLPLICYNGGYVIQYQNGSAVPFVFDHVTIPASVCESIAGFAQGTSVHVSVYYENEWLAPQHDQWTEREERITKVKATITPIEEIIHRWRSTGMGAHKLMCMGPEDEIATMAKQLQEKHSNHIHVYYSRTTYLELAPRSISKASALQLVMEKVYNIPMSSVMAFGDNYNDVEMLRSVGLGIAVENARDEAKGAAKKITSKSIEDGVAIAIEEVIRH
jgi:Cof subfamily protein (haloacid dehalogenase superfamily)